MLNFHSIYSRWHSNYGWPPHGYICHLYQLSLYELYHLSWHCVWLLQRSEGSGWQRPPNHIYQFCGESDTQQQTEPTAALCVYWPCVLPGLYYVTPTAWTPTHETRSMRVVQYVVLQGITHPRLVRLHVCFPICPEFAAKPLQKHRDDISAG